MLMDVGDVDLLVSASQKGLMVRLGVTLLGIPDRLKARGRTELTTPSRDWTRRAGTTDP